MDLSIIYDSLIYASLIIIGVCIVQGFLSSRKWSFLGLILPLASFVFSLVAIYYLKDFVGDHGLEGMEEVGYYALQFGVGNLPTFILLIIYSIFKYDKSNVRKRKTADSNKMVHADDSHTE